MNRRNLDRSLSVITQIVIYALLFLLAASTLLPYILMIALSLMAEFEMYQIPPKFIPTILRWSNYIEMWQAQPWGRYIFKASRAKRSGTRNDDPKLDLEISLVSGSEEESGVSQGEPSGHGSG